MNNKSGSEQEPSWHKYCRQVMAFLNMSETNDTEYPYRCLAPIDDTVKNIKAERIGKQIDRLIKEETYHLQKLCEEQRRETEEVCSVARGLRDKLDAVKEALGGASLHPETGVSIVDDVRDLKSQLAEWKRTGCRACVGDKGHYEGCHGEAPLVIENEQLRFQLAEKEKEIERLKLYNASAYKIWKENNDLSIQLATQTERARVMRVALEKIDCCSYQVRHDNCPKDVAKQALNEGDI